MSDKKTPQFDVIKLQAFIVEYFSLEELQQLCFELAVKYDNLPGDNTLNSKSRHLLGLLKRHNRLSELATLLANKRENFEKADYYKKPTPFLKPLDDIAWWQFLKKKRVAVPALLLTISAIIYLFYSRPPTALANEVYFTIAELEGCSPEINERIIDNTVNVIIDHVKLVEFDIVKDDLSQAGLIIVQGECANDDITLTVQSNQLSPVFVQLFNESQVLLQTSNNDASLLKETQIIRGIIYYTQANYESATIIFKELGNRNQLETEDVGLYYANSLLLNKEYEDAVDIYDSIIESSIDQDFKAGVLNNKGVSLFNRAVELTFDNELDIEAVQKNENRSLESFQSGINETNNRTLLQMLYANSGILLSRFGKNAQAQADCEMALGFNSEDLWANICMAAAKLPHIIQSKSCDNANVSDIIQIHLNRVNESGIIPIELFYWQKAALSVEATCKISSQSSTNINQTCKEVGSTILELKRRGFAPLHIQEDLETHLPSC